MLTKFNNDLKFKIILTIFAVSMIVGLICLFIKPLAGFTLLVFGGILNFYLHKKFPDSMKSFLNEQQKSRAATWVQRYKVEHIQGINFVDYGRSITLKMTKQNISFIDSDKEIFSLQNNKIENVVILEEIEQTQKNKSVVARAVVGGLLLGGVGAVVGGLSGVCPEMKQSRKYYLEISGGDIDKIILTASNKTLKQIKISLSSIAK